MKRYQPRRGFKITISILGFSILLLPLLGFIALLGIVASIICFLTFGGFEKVYVHPFEDSKRYKECFFGQIYNTEDRLRKEKENLERYQKEQQESWKDARIGFGIFLAGLVVSAFFLILAFFIPQFILGVFPGYFLMFMSYRWFWDAFINSALPIAAKISDTFLIRSTSVKIQETSKLIEVLSKNLEEEKVREEKIYGTVLE